MLKANDSLKFIWIKALKWYTILYLITTENLYTYIIINNNYIWFMLSLLWIVDTNLSVFLIFRYNKIISCYFDYLVLF